MTVKCSCIIPIYNEEKRILDLLRVVTEVKNISEVICVDDGSVDNSAYIIKSTFKNVKVIVSKKNEGKAEAIKKGVEAASTNNILLLDGDLYNVKKDELEKVISLLENNPSVDMIILRRLYEASFSKMIRGDITVSGERILKRDDLLKIFSLHPKRYQIEVAINKYMIQHHKHVYWFHYSGTNPPKIKKIGIRKGLVKEVQMHADIISYIGLPNLLYQMLFFCRQEVK